MSEPVIREASLAEILDLRHAVLRSGLPREAAEFDGDDEPTTRHFAAFVDGALAGCATCVRRPLADQPGWQLRGMATQPSLQGRGIGTALLRFIENTYQAEGSGLLWCNARIESQGFYVRGGWKVVSEVFHIETVGPHVRMTWGLAAQSQLPTSSLQSPS